MDALYLSDTLPAFSSYVPTWTDEEMQSAARVAEQLRQRRADREQLRQTLLLALAQLDDDDRREGF